MPSEFVAPAAALTAALGLFVAGQAYRGYRRHDSRPMLALAVGIALLTAIPFAISYLLAPVVGLTDAQALLGVVCSYVVGLSAILASLR